MKKIPAFSIVIPTLNEEKYLPKLLKDLTNQTFDDFEVIIVDGKSDDKTVQKANKFQEFLNLKMYTSSHRHVSTQRNIGAEKAKGTWIIFMDADNRLPAFFLDGIKYQIAKSPQVDIFTTWVRADDESTMSKTVEKLINLGLEIYRHTNKPSAMGALVGCRKEIVSQIQFDEKQKFLEDGLFVNEVCALGYNFMVFREPKFTYSLRRLRKEGTLKNISNVAILQFKYLQGKDFSSENRYQMLGGGYYEESGEPLIKQLHSLLTNASHKQLSQIKRLMMYLKESE